MKLTLTGLKQFDRKIPSIKALRNVTAYGLVETKNIVDGMINDHRNGNAISCVVTVRDPGGTPLKTQFLELAQYFDFTGEPSKKTIELKLWEVTCAIKSNSVVSGAANKLRTGIAYVLASSQDRATNTITHHPRVDSVTGCKEVKPPFEDGHLLFMWNYK